MWKDFPLFFLYFLPFRFWNLLELCNLTVFLMPTWPIKLQQQQFKRIVQIFWDKTCWFLSLRFFGLLSSLLFPQCFGRYVLRTSSGVCRTLEPSRNFELHPLLKPRGSPVLIPFAITGYKCYVFLYITHL